MINNTQTQRLSDMIKLAKNTKGLEIPNPIKPNNDAPKLTSLANIHMKTSANQAKSKPLGFKKPLFTSKMKNNNPYNER